MNIVLCGYHWPGCDALRRLLEGNHRVFVYTHEAPYHIPSLRAYCEQTGTDYSLANISKVELPFVPDCIASIYYRNIIKPHVIQACGGRIFNLHPSLLPAYRGCSSLTWAMIRQEPQVGFTYHYVDEGCYTGRIFLQQQVPVMPFDTQATLYQRVSTLAMEHFEHALELVEGGAPGTEQVGEVSHYPRGCPYGGQIDPAWSEAQIETFIRAMIYPPYPPAQFQGEAIYTLADYRRVRQETIEA